MSYCLQHQSLILEGNEHDICSVLCCWKATSLPLTSYLEYLPVHKLAERAFYVKQEEEGISEGV